MRFDNSLMLFGNSPQDWAAAFTIALGIFITARIVLRFGRRQIEKVAPAEEAESWQGLVAEALLRIHRLFLLVLAVYAGSLLLKLPASVGQVIDKVFFIAMLLQLGFLGSHALRSAFDRYRRKRIEQNAEAVTALSSVAFLLRVLLWIIILLVALDNFGADVTALIAGLGVGGIAIALAVQNILGDLFASFSIVLDKPFVIGDFIIVGDYLGTVEYVGLKTTRLRSLSGEQLVFSNTDLLGSRIRNYKRMFERRVVFSFGVVYETRHGQLERIPQIVRKIIEPMAGVRFDRAHFKEYGTYALNFEVVYYVLSPDYNIYMDIQQDINLSIYRDFQKENISFAYPTQTLVVKENA